MANLNNLPEQYALDPDIDHPYVDWINKILLMFMLLKRAFS